MSFELLSGVKLGSAMSSVNLSPSENKEVEIFAEGVYDAQTGSLCMVGCQNLVLDDQRLTNVDCSIVVNLQFPPYNSKNSTIYTKGSIESTREISDPLHFGRLELSAISFYAVETKEFIRRMEFEVSADLISKTFSCIFVGSQLLYARRYPHVVPFISIAMLLARTLSQMVLLVLDVYGEILLLGSGWIEVNKVIIRVVTMVGFVLQFYLMNLTRSARQRDGNQKSLWDAEKKVLFTSLQIYAVGVLIALLARWWRIVDEPMYFMASPSASHLVGDQEQSFSKDMKSYAGFVVEGFLLPQILFNIFRNSKESALSYPFYVGSSLVKWLSQIYCAHGILGGARLLPGRLEYIDPGADCVYDMWVFNEGFVLAIIIFLQQHFGGCCILPRRFREM